MPANMKLYSWYRSSSAWRVRIGMAYKGIAHETVSVNLLQGEGEQHSAAFHVKNPMEQIPVLELDDGSFRLTQSVAILEFLEELYPAPALLPRDMRLRARVRQFVEIINSGIQPLQNLKLQQTLTARGVDFTPLVQGFIETGLRALETTAAASAGTYLVGDHVTLADVYLIPQLHQSRLRGVDVEKFPLLRRVELACEQLPAFQAAHPNAQPDRPAA